MIALRTASILAVLALLLYGFVVTVLLFVPVPAENKEIVAGAVGLIGGTLVGSAFGYFFGARAAHHDVGAPPRT